MRICPRGHFCNVALGHGPGNRVPPGLPQPLCQSVSVSHAALGKFADNRAGFVSSIGYHDFSLSPERDNRFPDFESLQQARLHKEHQERRRGPTGICKTPSKPGRDDRMTVSLKLIFLDLSEACTYVPGENAIDGYTGHMVGRIPEPLKIGFRFTHTLEGCRIAGLHIDAHDVPRIVVYRVPQPAVTVLNTSLENGL